MYCYLLAERDAAADKWGVASGIPPLSWPFDTDVLMLAEFAVGILFEILNGGRWRPLFMAVERITLLAGAVEANPMLFIGVCPLITDGEP